MGYYKVLGRIRGMEGEFHSVERIYTTGCKCRQTRFDPEDLSNSVPHWTISRVGLHSASVLVL